MVTSLDSTDYKSYRKNRKHTRRKPYTKSRQTSFESDSEPTDRRSPDDGYSGYSGYNTPTITRSAGPLSMLNGRNGRIRHSSNIKTKANRPYYQPDMLASYPGEEIYPDQSQKYGNQMSRYYESQQNSNNAMGYGIHSYSQTSLLNPEQIQQSINTYKALKRQREEQQEQDQLEMAQNHWGNNTNS